MQRKFPMLEPKGFGIAICEMCHCEAPSKPWPSGWVRSGRSRIRVAAEKKWTAALAAWWCPLHTPATFMENPSDRDCSLIREQIMADAAKGTSKC